jgi:hypothetical protein
VDTESTGGGSEIDGPQRHRVHHRHDRAKDGVFEQVSQSERHPGVLAVEGKCEAAGMGESVPRFEGVVKVEGRSGHPPQAG